MTIHIPTFVFWILGGFGIFVAGILVGLWIAGNLTANVIGRSFGW
jgi:hypothetical protein